MLKVRVCICQCGKQARSWRTLWKILRKLRLKLNIRTSRQYDRAWPNFFTTIEWFTMSSFLMYDDKYSIFLQQQNDETYRASDHTPSYLLAFTQYFKYRKRWQNYISLIKNYVCVHNHNGARGSVVGWGTMLEAGSSPGWGEFFQFT
jgi:hypothetical protein